MPKLKAHLLRAGPHARGAARINQLAADEPNTASAEWKEKHPDGAATSDVLEPEQRLGGSSSDASCLTVAEVNRFLKRKGSERSGAGWAGGKHPRTYWRRAVRLEQLLLLELEAQQTCNQHVDAISQILSNREKFLKPEAERLGYDPLHLYDMYITVRHYFSLRAQGAGAVTAGDDAGWTIMVCGRSVRRWARDFLATNTRHTREGEEPEPKDTHTFSPYLMGSHVEWLLADEATAQKARKWIGLNAEVKGKAPMTVETFRRYLRRLGFSYDLRKQNVYVDGFDREDVVTHRLDVYREWVDGGKDDVHVDAFEWRSAKNPNGIDRMREWGSMGGTLSSKMLPCERPVMQLLQDETTVKAHDCPKYVSADITAYKELTGTTPPAALLDGLVSDLDSEGVPKENSGSQLKCSQLFTAPCLQQMYADDALVASKLNAGSGGKQPLMRTTTFPSSCCGPRPRNLTALANGDLEQTMVFRAGDVVLNEKDGERTLAADDPLVGKPKGIVQVLKECNVQAATPRMLMATARMTATGERFSLG